MRSGDDQHRQGPGQLDDGRLGRPAARRTCARGVHRRGPWRARRTGSTAPGTSDRARHAAGAVRTSDDARQHYGGPMVALPCPPGPQPPHQGFVWTARVAGVIAGSDHYLDGAGGMDWKLAGLVTVAHADGPDVSRSAAGRGAAEAVWLPTAMLPRFGVRWSAHDDTHITARYHLGATPIDVHYSPKGISAVRSPATHLRRSDHPQCRSARLALRD
jgi:hypothetical protein